MDADTFTTIVRRKGKEYTVYTECLQCKFFVAKVRGCRAFPQANKNKPTADTDRAYKYTHCGDWQSKV